MPEIQYGDKKVSYELIKEWNVPTGDGVGYLDPTDDGDASWTNLKASATAGIPGTLGLLTALGYRPTLTSGWRSQESNSRCGGASNSYHLTGTAIDICCANQTDEFCTEFCQKMADGGFWAFTLAHEGTGFHIHLDNYLGGLAGETDEQKKALQAQNLRTGGTPVNGDASINNPKVNPGAHMVLFKGKMAVLMPRYTFCEPVYPDLIYVLGNIPNGTLEKKLVNGDKYSEKTTTETDK